MRIIYNDWTKSLFVIPYLTCQCHQDSAACPFFMFYDKKIIYQTSHHIVCVLPAIYLSLGSSEWMQCHCRQRSGWCVERILMNQGVLFLWGDVHYFVLVCVWDTSRPPEIKWVSRFYTWEVILHAQTEGALIRLQLFNTHLHTLRTSGRI